MRLVRVLALSTKPVAVLSNNLIEEIEGISKLAELKKLSLSSNKIKIIPDLSGLHTLSGQSVHYVSDNCTEIKLNKNMIMKIPDTMSLNVNLKIIDLGNNSIREFK
jgi:Leucine-rich repeat (LRR) protein